MLHAILTYHAFFLQAPSGWLGPDFSSGKGTGVEYWGPSNVLLALTSFAEGTTTTGQTDLSKNVCRIHNRLSVPGHVLAVVW